MLAEGAGAALTAAGVGSVLVEVTSVVEQFVDAAPQSVTSVAAVLAAYYAVGTLLLTVSPDFSRTVTVTVTRRPIRAAVLGAVLAVVVAGLAVASFSVLWITGPFLVFALVWLPVALAALLYVSLAVTGGVLSVIGIDNRYGVLAVSGVVPLAFLWTPQDYAVDFVFLAVTVLGGGAMLWSLWDRGRDPTS